MLVNDNDIDGVAISDTLTSGKKRKLEPTLMDFRGFHFTRHKRYNLPEKRLSAIEKKN